jgi:hypothetical protein
MTAAPFTPTRFPALEPAADATVRGPAVRGVARRTGWRLGRAAAAAVACGLAWPVLAQTPSPVVQAPAADAPDAAASAVPRRKPEPRLMAPAEARDKTITPGELRPERPVAPQIAIPVFRPPPGPLSLDGPTPRPRTPRPRDRPAATGTVDDAVARCSAEADDAARARCLDTLEAPPREKAPG